MGSNRRSLRSQKATLVQTTWGGEVMQADHRLNAASCLLQHSRYAVIAARPSAFVGSIPAPLDGEAREFTRFREPGRIALCIRPQCASSTHNVSGFDSSAVPGEPLIIIVAPFDVGELRWISPQETQPGTAGWKRQAGQDRVSRIDRLSQALRSHVHSKHWKFA